MRRITAVLLLIAFLISCGTSTPPVSTPSAQGQTFQKIKIVRTERGESKEREVILQFTEEDIFIEGKEPELNIRYGIPYDKMTKAIYERSQHPRIAPTLLVSVFFLFSKSKKHWLTIYYNTPENKEDFVLLRLDKRNYKMVLATMETKTGITVERHEER